MDENKEHNKIIVTNIPQKKDWKDAIPFHNPKLCEDWKSGGWCGCDYCKDCCICMAWYRK